MCGRTACTLAPDDIGRACTHRTRDGRRSRPQWRNPPGGQSYYTSYNVAPGTHTPVLLSRKHFESEEKFPVESEKTEFKSDTDSSETVSDWVIQPMHWGLVPHWSPQPKSVGYSMINARSDGILSKNAFKRPLEKGRRCVVLVDGYYEWQKLSDGKKQPYFISFPSAADTDVKAVNEELDEDGEEKWSGRRLLTLAGLFDIWRPKDDGPPLYSYSIITVDAHKSLSFLHERMPAVLDGEEEVKAWIDFGDVPLNKAMPLIRSVSGVSYYPVSSLVGDVKNKSEDCIKPIDLEKKEKKDKASSNLMMAWLKKGDRKRTSEEREEGDKGSSGPSPGKRSRESCPVKKEDTDS